MIKVLVVDDSPTIQELMKHILTSDREIEVIGIANNGLEAIKFLERMKPDIVTMDINMPCMNGFEATEIIMETNPVPIIMVTSLFDSTDIEGTFKGIQAGALSVIKKPSSIRSENYKSMCDTIIETVKLMSEIKVVRRKFNRVIPTNKIINKGSMNNFSDTKVVAIGVSTGGPPILKEIFSRLNENLSFPILVVQHITPGFINGLVGWLKHFTNIPISIASNGERVLPGHIYFAPDDYHMEVAFNGKVMLNKKEKVKGLRPTVSHMFASISNVYGEKAIAILLSGMGSDGVDELKLLKEKGAVTIAQDKDSSVVYGMPGEAVKINAASYVLSPQKIAELLNEL